MPATNPQAGDVHVSRPITQFSEKFILDNGVFVGMGAMPNVPVQFQFDQYYKYNIGDWLRRPGAGVIRADGAESAGVSWKMSTGTYSAVVRALHKDVSDRQRANQDEGIDLDRDAAEFVTQQLLIEREALFAATYMATGVWTASDQNVDWSAAASDPINDIRQAARIIQGRTGYRPNRFTIARRGFDTLMENDSVIARISGGATQSAPAKVNKALLAALLEVDEINVMESVQNSALEGATDAIDFIAPDNALLYYAPRTVAIGTVTAGIQFSWRGYVGATPSGQRTKKFRMPHLESDRVEVDMAFDYKVVAPSLGYLFTTVSQP